MQGDPSGVVTLELQGEVLRGCGWGGRQEGGDRLRVEPGPWAPLCLEAPGGPLLTRVGAVGVLLQLPPPEG